MLLTIWEDAGSVICFFVIQNIWVCLEVSFQSIQHKIWVKFVQFFSNCDWHLYVLFPNFNQGLRGQEPRLLIREPPQKQAFNKNN